MRIAIFSDTFSPEINGVATSTSNLHTILNRMGHFLYYGHDQPIFQRDHL